MAVQERSVGTSTGVRQWAANWPLIAVFSATLLRMILFISPSHGYDTFAYKHWTWRLAHQPMRQFYVDDGQAFPDHLPGDLWLFKIVGSAVRFADPGFDFYGPVYGVMISLLATGFDAALAITLLIIGRSLGLHRAGEWASIAYWCAPAPIFVASVWGQIDAVATTLAIVTLGLALHGRFGFAFVVLTLCVLVKPQFVLLALPLLVGWWRMCTDGFLVWLMRVAATAMLCIGIVAAISFPFGVSLVGGWGEWSLLERVQLANDTYTVSVLGAHNIWALFEWAPDDRGAWLFGVSRHGLGIMLLGAVIAYTTWVLLARWRGVITMVLASNVLLFGFFLFMTRMHERYLFPVVALSILLALLDRRYVWYAVWVNALVFLNIALRFIWPINDDWSRWQRLITLGDLEHNGFVQILAILTLFVFLWLTKEASRPESP